MKKILCAFIAALMLAAQCAVYAETDTAVNNLAADNDIELMAVPVDEIIGDDEDKLTSGEAERIEETIAQAVKEAVPPEDITEQERLEISVEGIDAAARNAAMKIALNFLADNPEYFYFDDKTATCSMTGGALSKLYIYYTRSASETKNIQGELDEMTDDILMQMRKDGVDLDAIKSGTDEEKKQAQFDAALWVHDYLADTITYDYRALDAAEEDKVERSIDAALLGERLTVCEGYAKSYKYILEKIGMECINVYSSLEQHEWSAVKIGDAWYYVDVTQDDSDTIKNINHSFFLVTEEELLGGGTHEGGYITEFDKSEITFGKEFEGALWHGNWQEIPAGDEESEPKRRWHDSIIGSRVVFDGNDRYYCGFDNSNAANSYSAIYKCGADLTNPEEFYVMDDGKWYTDPASESGGRSYISGYKGGLGKYTYEATDSNAKRTCLYFNSPTAVYELELGADEARKVDGCEYTPVEGEYYNCIFGISTYDTLMYQIVDMIVTDRVSFEPKEKKEKTIACNVSLYNGTENPEFMDILTYPKDAKLNVPDYKPYGVVLKSWVRDLTTGTPWNFETDTLTENVKLYADTAEAKMGEQPLRIDARSGKLIGTLNASIVDFDDTYREAPTYMLAIYDNNTLVAVKTSGTGEFNIAPEDNIPYTDTTMIKVYAWSSENEPYLDGAPVEIIEDLTGGEGEGETGDGDEGEEAGGDGEDEGDTGSGGTGSESSGSGGSGGSSDDTSSGSSSGGGASDSKDSKGNISSGETGE